MAAELRNELRRVRRATERVAQAATEREESIRAARTAGASLRAIAAEAGLTAGRIHQILKEEK